MNGFDIIIKDNFLDKELFKKIHNQISTFTYLAEDNMIYNVNHIWFSCPADEEIQEIVLLHAKRGGKIHGYYDWYETRIHVLSSSMFLINIKSRCVSWSFTCITNGLTCFCITRSFLWCL